jgi:hypothetical protein
MASMATIIEPSNQWQITPQSFFSRHYNLLLGGELVAALRMSFWIEGCEFSIAGHEFAIRRVSLWKDGFQLLTGDQCVCQVKRGFWSRRFELSATLDDSSANWILQPAGWFTRSYQLLAGQHEVGTVRPIGWFTRTRVADFADDVPLPVQVFAIFLVLVVSQRQQRRNSAGGG